MMNVTLSLSNDEIRALAIELPKLRALLADKMINTKLDKKDGATPAYMVLCRLERVVFKHPAAARRPSEKKKRA